jgi:HSP20 family molecular chaperone IbpA
MYENKSGDVDMNTEQFENFFGRKIPFTLPDQADHLVPDTSWVETYVQDVLKNVMTSADVPSFSKYPTEVFETLKSVIIKVTIPDTMNPNEIQVFIKSDQVKLEGLPDGQKTVIKLPWMVIPKSGIVRFKRGVLQISIRKRMNNEQYHEANVQF